MWCLVFLLHELGDGSWNYLSEFHSGDFCSLTFVHLSGFSAQHLRWMITFSPYCMESWRRSFENWIAGCLSNQPEFGFPYLCVFVLSHVLLFCNPIDYSLLCPSVHGIFQARILEWFSISSSRESFQHRDRTYVFFIAGRFFTTAPPRKTLPYVQRADNYPTLCLL